MPETVAVQINGESIQVPPGISVAAAILLANHWTFRTSVTGEPRAPVCGMGICFECRVTIDGKANCRSCQIAVVENMRVETT